MEVWQGIGVVIGCIIGGLIVGRVLANLLTRRSRRRVSPEAAPVSSSRFPVGSALIDEVQKNLATARRAPGETLLPFQTEVWDQGHNGVHELPADLQESI